VIKYFLVLFLFVFSLSGMCAQDINKHKSMSIPKSPNDQREYLSITLDNNLDVMLISDSTSDKASAALDVYVGSSNDPQDFLGLAHFLEHMLFLGTKKYPNPDEYQKFISDHGGSHNAYTSLNHTNYFFDIQSDFLEKALDRFSQQFTAPLFNEEYVEREINAVHSEYTAKIKDDGRRFFSAIKEILSDNHPYSKFSVGNLETLTDNPEKSLRGALLEFYADHYSANKMKLVILGKEPLETLKKWAIDKFSDIPNKNIELEHIKQPFFGPNDLPAQLNVQSIMDKRSLTVAFPIPSDSLYKASKPINYLANLIGHEGKGSLLSKLKAKGLVNSLSAGSEFDTQINAMFMINMSLTQKGLDNHEDILNILFNYLSLLKSEGIQKLYFDEQAQLLDIAFKFQEKSEPIHFTSSLATALQESHADTVLVEDYQLTDYKPSLYLEFIEHLSPKNMFAALSANDLETNRKTQWYQAPYKFFKLDQNLINELESVEADPSLHMPIANEFIPESTALLSKPNHKPELLKQSKGLDVWYAFDSSFGTPKANIFLTLRSPISNSSADNFNKTDILVSLLKDSLNEYSYPAYLAGLHFELYQHMRGITVKISGYNDKQSNLLIKIINALKGAKFKLDRFETIKDRLHRQLENAADKKPFQQAISKAQNNLISPSWNEKERLKSLSKLEFEAINNYRNEFLEELEAVLLINGNITRASSLNIANQIKAFLLHDIKNSHVERAKINKLTGAKVWASAIDVDHSDTGFVYYLQGNDKSIAEQARFMLLNQIISTDFYGTIRTDKQLGYIVFSTNFSLLDMPAIAFIVQSPTAKSDVLFAETRSFLENQLSNLAMLSSTDLEKFKQAVISKLLKQDNTLYSRSNRYWQDIDRENKAFDTNAVLADTVSEVSTNDLQILLKRLISEKGQGLLTYTFTDKDNLNYKELGLEEFSEKIQNSLTKIK
tara:strand:+ start:6854 stop:9700 length:2847 start_codon:yes stop_codon:yes gene_type:complete